MLRACLLAWMTAAPLLAQDGALPSSALSRRSNEVLYDDAGAGGIWARGLDYKVGIDARGVCFVPWFGAAVPRSLPLELRFVAARRSASELLFENDAAPKRSGDRIELDRGALIERYDCAPRSVEQSFVLERAPQGAGDLEIRLRVTTALEASVTEAGFEFRHAGYGSVRYGRATAIDARGAQRALETELFDEHIAIRVPAALLAEAAYPLIVDPLITVVSLHARPNASFVNGDVSLVYDYSGASFAHKFLAVFEEEFSASDSDVWAYTLDAAGAVLLGPVAIDLSTSSWTKVCSAASQIAQINGVTGGDFLVAAELHPAAPLPNTGLATRIATRRVRALDLALGGQMLSVDSVALPLACGAPDVGGDASFYLPSGLASGEYCVVFEYRASGSDRDIYGVRIDTLGNTIGAPFPIAVDPQFDERAPSISKSAGRDDGASFPGTQRWVAAWEREYTPADRDLWALTIRPDGTIPGASFPLTSSSDDETEVDISAPLDEGPLGRRVVAVFTARPAGGGRTTIRAVEVAGDFPAQMVPVALLADPSSANHDLRAPAVATDGVRFALGWSRSPQPFSANWTEQLATLRFAAGVGVIDDVDDFGIGHVGGPGNLALASHFSVAPSVSSARYLATIDARTAVADAIESALYEGRASGGLTRVATSCGGLLLTSAGAPILGTYLALSLTGASSAALEVLWIGFPTPFPLPLCGTCALGVLLPAPIEIDRALTAPLEPYFEVVVPSEPTLVGLVLAAQGAALALPGGCPLEVAPGMSLEVALSDTLWLSFQ